MVKPQNNTKSSHNELANKLARALADYANLEKRFEKESSHVIKFANASLLGEILSVKDNLERASKTIKDNGIKMVLEQLETILKDQGVREIETTNFDPSLMECEDVVVGEKDKVIEVLAKGYTLHDSLLRRARVTVGKGKAK